MSSQSGDKNSAGQTDDQDEQSRPSLLGSSEQTQQGESDVTAGSPSVDGQSSPNQADSTALVEAGDSDEPLPALQQPLVQPRFSADIATTSRAGKSDPSNQPSCSDDEVTNNARLTLTRGDVAHRIEDRSQHKMTNEFVVQGGSFGRIIYNQVNQTFQAAESGKTAVTGKSDHPLPSGAFRISSLISVLENDPISISSRVFRAILHSDVTGERKIAVKITPADKKHRREAKIHFLVPYHKNIVERISADIFNFRGQNSIYIAMEHCDCNLYDHIKSQVRDGVPFDPLKYISITHQIVLALNFLHSHNIVHGDLKPGNVLLILNANVVKLSDFGLSRAIGGDNSSTQLTSPQGGTAGWLAPEILEGTTRIAPENDIFPLGLVCHFALSYGKHPYGDQPHSWNHYILEGTNLNLERMLIPNNDSAKTLLEPMLQRDPAGRPTARQVLEHEIFASQGSNLPNQDDDRNVAEAIDRAFKVISHRGTDENQNIITPFGVTILQLSAIMKTVMDRNSAGISRVPISMQHSHTQTRSPTAVKRSREVQTSLPAGTVPSTLGGGSLQQQHLIIQPPMKRWRPSDVNSPPQCSTADQRCGMKQVGENMYIDAQKPLREGYEVYDGQKRFDEATGIESRVAVKIFHVTGSLKARWFKKFQEEVKNLRALKWHRYVALFEDCGVVKDNNLDAFYIAMSRCHQTTLQDIEIEKLKPSDRIDIFLQICHGLKFIHGRDIAHMDLKLSNILFSLDGRNAVISDFGLSKHADIRHSHQKTILSKSSKQSGTLGWRAVELLKGEVSRIEDYFKSDIFALGLVGMNLLFGYHPFADSECPDNMAATNTNIYREEPPSMDLLQHNQSDGFLAIDLFRALLSHNADDRPKIGDVLKHFYFWSAEKKVRQIKLLAEYLRRCNSSSKRAKNTSQKPESSAYIDTEVLDIAEVCDNPSVHWMEKLKGTSIYDRKTAVKKEFDNTVVGLSRYLRNCCEHRIPPTENIKYKEMWVIIVEKFPNLLPYLISSLQTEDREIFLEGVAHPQDLDVLILLDGVAERKSQHSDQ